MPRNKRTNSGNTTNKEWNPINFNPTTEEKEQIKALAAQKFDTVSLMAEMIDGSCTTSHAYDEKNKAYRVTLSERDQSSVNYNASIIVYHSDLRVCYCILKVALEAVGTEKWDILKEVDSLYDW